MCSKSTLSTLLSACSVGDAQALQARKTIDGTNWSSLADNLHVFNQEFVERNVYAGAAVTPEQRASLLAPMQF